MFQNEANSSRRLRTSPSKRYAGLPQVENTLRARKEPEQVTLSLLLNAHSFVSLLKKRTHGKGLRRIPEHTGCSAISLSESQKV